VIDIHDGSSAQWEQAVEGYFASLRQRIDALAKQRNIDLEKRFESRILLIDRFSEIFDFWDKRPDRSSTSYVSKALEPETYIESISQHPPLLLLHAPGGFGKSSFLLRMVASATQRQMIPFYLDFASSTNEPNFKNKDRPTLEEIFQHFSPQAGFKFYSDLSEKFPNRRFLFLFDSINERLYDWTYILGELHSLLDRPNRSIVIADRMKERTFSLKAALATALPLSVDFVKQYVLGSPALQTHIDLSSEPRWFQLLEMPLFLNLVEQVYSGAATVSRNVNPTRVSLLQYYFERSAGLSQEQMRDVGKLGLRFYSEALGTEIDESRLRGLFDGVPAGHKLYDTLLDGGALVRSGDTAAASDSGVSSARVRFRHQTLHDFLVGYYLASVEPGQDEELWRNRVFDDATLLASSFEVLDYTVEALAERNDPHLTADLFLTEVYDWNYRAVIEAVSGSGERPGRAQGNQLSKQFRTAIYALNAEKRFDHFKHTKESTEQAFSGIPRVGDLAFLNASSVEDLLDKVGQLDFFKDTVYWQNWQKLFSRDMSASEVTRDDLIVLWKDPVFSWTAANVFRRAELSGEIQVELQRYCELSRATSEQAARAGGFRWRVVHVLGRSTSETNLKFLFDRALDSGEYFWVRYGAIRSYVEAVSLMPDKEARRAHLGILAANIEKLLLRVGDDPQKMSPDERQIWLRETAPLRKELMRCRELNDQVTMIPEGWIDDYNQVYQAAIAVLQRLGASNEASEWQKRLAAQ
jgi:hypothetical protein